MYHLRLQIVTPLTPPPTPSTPPRCRLLPSLTPPRPLHPSTHASLVGRLPIDVIWGLTLRGRGWRTSVDCWPGRRSQCAAPTSCRTVRGPPPLWAGARAGAGVGCGAGPGSRAGAGCGRPPLPLLTGPGPDHTADSRRSVYKHHYCRVMERVITTFVN